MRPYYERFSGSACNDHPNLNRNYSKYYYCTYMSILQCARLDRESCRTRSGCVLLTRQKRMPTRYNYYENGIV